MPNIELHELNAHLFAQLLPETHGAKAKKAKPAAPAPYTAEQRAILAAAGITDPTAADPQAVAAILG